MESKLIDISQEKFNPYKTNVITAINVKGGIGKTHILTDLALLLADSPYCYKIIAVDGDAQATQYFSLTGDDSLRLLGPI